MAVTASTRPARSVTPVDDRGAGTAGNLVSLLRTETTDLHRRVEAALPLPQSIGSPVDYGALLAHLLTLHAPLEQALSQPGWRAEWSCFGVEIDWHRRSHLLRADLAELGHCPLSDRPEPPLPGSFPQALGCLYVLAGSALGGRVLAPLITAAIGKVPITFFLDEDGRRRRAWPRLLASLSRFDLVDEYGEVAVGAIDTFTAFETLLVGFGGDRPAR